jgi:regulatory protein
MAGKITKLQYQKHDPDRANVFLDDKFAFGLPVLEAAKLRVGMFLSDADIARLQEQDTFLKTYERAMRFLGYRPRSRAEVKRNLASAGIDEGVIEAVLERLASEGYLNDAEFARFWVENREQFQPRGDRALRQELRQKGLDDQTVGEALANLDPTGSAYRAGRPRALRMASLYANDPRGFRQKLGNFLLRRGFGYEVVRSVVRQLEQEVASGRAEAEEPEADEASGTDEEG